jgi:hypothetical protein
VKYPTLLNLTLVNEVVHVGENITVKGFLIPHAGDLPVTVVFTSGNVTKKIEALTLADGNFTAGFQTENVGVWEVRAEFDGNESFYSSLSPSLTVRVEEPTFMMKYSLYIGGGAIGAVIASVVVYVKKFKE